MKTDYLERQSYPTYAVIDSQNVKTTYAGDQRGFDGGKMADSC